MVQFFLKHGFNNKLLVVSKKEETSGFALWFTSLFSCFKIGVGVKTWAHHFISDTVGHSESMESFVGIVIYLNVFIYCQNFSFTLLFLWTVICRLCCFIQYFTQEGLAFHYIWFFLLRLLGAIPLIWILDSDPIQVNSSDPMLFIFISGLESKTVFLFKKYLSLWIWKL